MGKGAWDYHRNDPRHPGNREHLQHKKKNTRDWCKGKVGRSHETEIVIPQNQYLKECRDAPSWIANSRRAPRPWFCVHHRVCKNCGKVLEWHYPWYLCPDLPERYRAQADEERRKLIA